MNYILYMHPKITTIYEMISQYEVIYNDFVSMWKAYYKLQLAVCCYIEHFSLNAFTWKCEWGEVML